MNLPNKLSILRIILVPFFVAFYFVDAWWGTVVAVAIFIVASFTDYLDGHIARKHNLVTDLGKFLDPIADKLLVCAALFCLVATNPLQYLKTWQAIAYPEQLLPLSFKTSTYPSVIFVAVGGIIIISRELLVSGMRMVASNKGVVVQANIYGKIKTVFQVVSLPLLLVTNVGILYFDAGILGMTSSQGRLLLICLLMGLIFFVLAVLMTIISGVMYFVQNKKVFENDNNNSQTV